MKIALFGLSIALSMLLSSPAFARTKSGDKKSGEHDCCASKASQSEVACIDYGSLNLTGDQKSKIETWQGDCLKAGCTKESRHTFLKQAKTILSPEQFAKLKEQCKHSKAAAKA